MDDISASSSECHGLKIELPDELQEVDDVCFSSIISATINFWVQDYDAIDSSVSMADFSASDDFSSSTCSTRRAKFSLAATAPNESPFESPNVGKKAVASTKEPLESFKEVSSLNKKPTHTRNSDDSCHSSILNSDHIRGSDYSFSPKCSSATNKPPQHGLETVPVRRCSFGSLMLRTRRIRTEQERIDDCISPLLNHAVHTRSTWDMETFENDPPEVKSDSSKDTVSHHKTSKTNSCMSSPTYAIHRRQYQATKPPRHPYQSGKNFNRTWF